MKKTTERIPLMREPVPAAVMAALAPHGRLRAAINMSNFLLVSGKDERGAPDGVSPDLAKAIAARLSVPCELIAYEGPGQLADDVGADIWDIGNIAIEPERSQTIDFTQSYVHIDANFMVRKSAPYQRNEDINKENVEIILYNRSAYDLWLTDNFIAPTYIRVASIGESHAEFHAGRANVLASLKPKLIEEIEASDAYRIIEHPFTAIRQAVGIAKDQPEAVAFINNIISELLKNGEISARLRAHNVDKKLSLPD